MIQSDEAKGYGGAMLPQRCQWLLSMTDVRASATTHHRGGCDDRPTGRLMPESMGGGKAVSSPGAGGCWPMCSKRRDGADGSEAAVKQGPIRLVAQMAVAHRLTPKKQIRT